MTELLIETTVRGCTRGMADFGAPGHNGDPRPAALSAAQAAQPGIELTPVTDSRFRYLIASTPAGVGVYLISAAGVIRDFTENTYEDCVREATTAGLAPNELLVLSRYNLYTTSGVDWMQYQDHTGPAFTVQAAPDLMDFTLDWPTVSRLATDAEVSIPTRTDCEHTELERLVNAAVASGALRGDPRIRLAVHGDLFDAKIGFSVTFGNRSNASGAAIPLSTEIHPLLFLADDQSDLDHVGYYLAQVRDVANALLAEMRTRRQPTPPV